MVLASDEIFVLDTFELAVSIASTATIFFDNDGNQDETITKQWVSNVLLPLDSAWRGKFNERSAPQSEAGGAPMLHNSVANDCTAILTGFIRKIVVKSFQPAKV